MNRSGRRQDIEQRTEASVLDSTKTAAKSAGVFGLAILGQVLALQTLHTAPLGAMLVSTLIIVGAARLFSVALPFQNGAPSRMGALYMVLEFTATALFLTVILGWCLGIRRYGAMMSLHTMF